MSKGSKAPGPNNDRLTETAALVDSLHRLVKEYHRLSLEAAFDNVPCGGTDTTEYTEYRERVLAARHHILQDFADKLDDATKKYTDNVAESVLRQARPYLESAWEASLLADQNEAIGHITKFIEVLNLALVDTSLDVEFSKYYHALYQSRTTNKLQKKLTQRIADADGAAQLDFYGNGAIIESDFKLFIRGYREIETVKQSAAMLLDSLMIQATKDGLQETRILLPLRDYMAMRGLKDEKATREQVKHDLDALARVSFEYKGIGKNKRAWFSVTLASTVGQVKNGDIVFRFNQDWFDSFKNSNGKFMFMYFPREALQANVKQHPYTYWLARKISEHKRMNAGKPNEDIIGVDTLIAACPNFPTYEDIMNSGRQVTQRIIEPFERDMDELKESLSWNYTPTDPPTDPTIDYQSFVSATITILWHDYPESKRLIAGKERRAQRIAGIAVQENPKPKKENGTRQNRAPMT